MPMLISSEKKEAVASLPEMQTPQSLTIFLIAHPEGNSEKILAVLNKHHVLLIQMQWYWIT